MASVKKLSTGQYQTRWAVYVEGKRRQLKRNFATAAEANQHRAQMELLEQRGIGSVRITVAEYLNSWLKTKEAEVGLNTMAGYRRWVDHILRGSIAAMPITKVTPLHVENLFRYLLTTPATRSNPLSAVSVRHVAAVLANAFADAVRHKLLPDNPAANARRPRGQSPRAVGPNPEQVRALLDDMELNNPALVDLATLLITTGLRRSEALGLRWQDVDFAAGRLTIAQVVIEHEGQWSIREGTKSIAGQRSFGLRPITVAALHRQQARVAEARRKIGRYWRDHDLAFPDELSGGPRSPAAVTKAFTRASKRIARLPCGWPEHASPVHSLRHGAATKALADGADVATVSARLGHSSPAVTMRIYAHALEDKDAAAADAMASQITPKRPR